jgi:tyrosine-protein phosphatase YwqE
MGFPWFSALKRERPAASGIGSLPLGMDFHNHLLPGVDDGMASFDDARSTIEFMQRLGFTGAVITPHIYKDVFNNASGPLRVSFERFRDDLAGGGINFPLQLAAEYFADEHLLGLIDADDLLSISVGDERWVLVEFPYLQETPFIGVCLSALVSAGYRPVIAHVERYRFVAQAPSSWLDRFARVGAVIQGDIGSLVGQYGPDVKRFALWLAEHEKVDIWGTDVHNPAQIERHIMPGLARLAPAARLNALLDPLLTGLAT